MLEPDDYCVNGTEALKSQLRGPMTLRYILKLHSRLNAPFSVGCPINNLHLSRISYKNCTSAPCKFLRPPTPIIKRKGV